VAATFVDGKFLPALKALATCAGGTPCRNALGDSMTFVDGHQAEFERHGMCAHAPTDPEFDRECFSADGKSFVSGLVAAADNPLACSLPASDYLPYASRARWIRSANDSYFAAMTYPSGNPATLKPTDIHDALWGVISAVYGGAVHPTAEGYAAMADAALPAARVVLGLPQPPAVTAEALPPISPTPPSVAAPPTVAPATRPDATPISIPAVTAAPVPAGPASALVPVAAPSGALSPDLSPSAPTAEPLSINPPGAQRAGAFRKVAGTKQLRRASRCCCCCRSRRHAEFPLQTRR
jgi:hypothetical protein